MCRPGFDPKGVLTFDLTIAGRKYADANAVLNTYRELWQRLGQLPGVTAAGATTSIPLSEAYAWTPITIEGRAPLAGEKFINSDARTVSGNYFQAMGIPLRRGRFFNEQDDRSKPRVVIIDQRMADEFWPKQDPVGRRIHIVQLNSKDPVADHRGRGGAGEAGFARLRSADRVLHAADAKPLARDDRRGARLGRSGEAGGRGEE